jgi:glucosamine kinase
MPETSLYIGLDAGGTKTEALARTAQRSATTRLAGPAANLQRQGPETTARVLATLIQQALEHHPNALLCGVCAGVAGAGSPADQQSLAVRVRNRLGDQAPAHVQVTDDGAIALEAAFEGGSGVIVMAGTGSALFARTHGGERVRAGGWGYLLGDEGSGHALGIHGLRAVAHALDGGPPTRLQALLADRHGLAAPDDLKRRVYREAWPVQQVAPLVIEAAAHGDDAAHRILAEQTRALARQAAWLAGRFEAIEPRLALLGGLTRNDFYKQALTDALLDALPGWRVEEPRHPPVAGALRLAMAHAS